MGSLFSGAKRDRNPDDAIQSLAYDMKRAKQNLKHFKIKVTCALGCMFVVFVVLFLTVSIVMIRLEWWKKILCRLAFILVVSFMFQQIRSYSKRKQQHYAIILNQLREKKKETLEQLENSESYNAAKELLDAVDKHPSTNQRQNNA